MTEAKAAEGGEQAQTPAPPDPGEQLRSVITSIRGRADLTAKAFGSLGTTAVTAIGISKFGDVFPWPGTGRAAFAAFLVVVGFFGMAGAVAFFTWQLWRVSEPIVMRSDPAAMEDDLRDAKERDIVADIYGELARMNGAPTLAVLEARGHRLARVSERAGAAGPSVAAESTAIASAVATTYSRAALLITRWRASRALTSFPSLAMFGVFVVSLVVFGMSADYLQGERTDSIALVKACGEAETANKGAKLPPICPDVSPAPTPSPAPSPPFGANPPRQVTKSVKHLASSLFRCSRAEGKRAAPRCAPIRRALSAALGELD